MGSVCAVFVTVCIAAALKLVVMSAVDTVMQRVER